MEVVIPIIIDNIYLLGKVIKFKIGELKDLLHEKEGKIV